jgi:carbamoyltransferase
MPSEHPTRRRAYLGFASTVHDPAIAIVSDEGEVVFAEALERPLQNKRAWHAAPDDIVRVAELVERWCPDAETLVAATSWSDRSLALAPLVRRALRLRAFWQSSARQRGRSDADQFAARLTTAALRQGMYRTAFPGADGLVNLEYRLFESSRGRRTLARLSFDHHLTHAANGGYTSPFSEALCAVVDGLGEGGSTAFYHLTNGHLRRLDRAPLLNLASLGQFYSWLCWACGFDPLRGEEWKVMGLAGYGTVNAECDALLRPMLRVKGLSLQRGPDFDARLAGLLALRNSVTTWCDAADLAATGQAIFGELMAALVTRLHATGLSDNLVLSGGCALNSSWNGRVLIDTPFRQLHVPSAPGDDGNAIGAALLAWRRDHPTAPLPDNSSPYLGSSLSRTAIDRLDRHSGLRVTRLAPLEIAPTAARLLAEGRLLGWAQGRAEFGPRALGNRSILADPRSPDVKQRLNALVKLREEFRPFAPAVLV